MYHTILKMLIIINGRHTSENPNNQISGSEVSKDKRFNI